MTARDMTVKEKVLRMVERLPEDVTYDRVLYHVEFMQTIDRRLEEAERGEVIPHEQVFAELLADDEESQGRVAGSRKRRPAGNQTVHRKERPSNGGGSRSPSQGRSGKVKKPS